MKKSTIILEVLGGKSNKKAVDFYSEFGFDQEIAYDPSAGKYTQVRDIKFNQIVYFMGKQRDSNGEFIPKQQLNQLLSLNKIRRSHRCFSPLAKLPENNSSKTPKKSKVPKYCISKCTLGGADSGHMIACDMCDNWYHLICVGISAEETLKMGKYYCTKCVEECKKELDGLLELVKSGWIMDVEFEERKKRLKKEIRKNAKKSAKGNKEQVSWDSEEDKDEVSWSD